MMLTCHLKATQQIVKLLLLNVLLRSLRQYTASSNIIEIVQPLSCILFDLVRHFRQGINAFLLQSHIIIIGGCDNGQFTLGIKQPTGLTVCKQMAFLIDTIQGIDCPLTELIKLTIA